MVFLLLVLITIHITINMQPTKTRCNNFNKYALIIFYAEIIIFIIGAQIITTNDVDT